MSSISPCLASKLCEVSDFKEQDVINKELKGEEKAQFSQDPAVS